MLWATKFHNQEVSRKAQVLCYNIKNKSDFSREKILSMPSFGSEVKPFTPCRRFAACKRSLNGVKKRNFFKITGTFSPTLSPRSARVDVDVEASGGESGNV
jgi:hypothetical protein